MAKIHDSILDTIGGTPLVRLNSLTKDLGAEVLVKVESFNPANSSKTASVRQSSTLLKHPVNSSLVAPSWRQLPATPVLHWHLSAQLVATRSS